MSPEVAIPECSSTDEFAVHSPAIVRTPFWWSSGNEPLFGWWHTLAARQSYNHAVVIAAPLGYEQVHAHRSLRHLADALAAAGLPAFRFDWHGTGDSAGLDEDPNRLSVWRNNLRDAVQLVKRRFGIPRVSVVGLRLGATLAASGLDAADLANLVLWAPVVSGRTYVREMTAIDRTSEIPAARLAGEPLDLEPSGFVLSEETARDLTPINLLTSPPLECPTLIVGRDDLPTDPRLHQACQEAGIAAEQITAPGFADMMISPHKGSVPRQAIAAIVRWLAECTAGEAITGVPAFPRNIADESVTMTYRPEGRYALSGEVGIREQILRLSTAPELFGILSEPQLPVSDDRPTLVLLNAGAASHVGPGRLNVHLARRLAAAGFRSVRIDASGLGDSVAADAACENQAYSATILRDIDLALQELQRRRLGRKFVLIGLCSGAYFSFQSAVSLTDPALVESVLINPLTFFWKDGMVISESSDRQVVVQQYYFESALNPRKWLKLLAGRTKIGVWGAAKIAAKRFAPMRRRINQYVEKTERPVRAVYAHPVQDDLPADLSEAAAKRRHLAMFFAESDPGCGILMHKADAQAKQLRQAGRLTVEFIANADHNFSRRRARRDLFDSLLRHLTSRCDER